MVIVYIYPHDWLIYMVCNCNCKYMPWPWMLWFGMPPSSSKNYYQDHYCIYFSRGFRESCILPTGILGGRSIPSHFLQPVVGIFYGSWRDHWYSLHYIIFGTIILASIHSIRVYEYHPPLENSFSSKEYVKLSCWQSAGFGHCSFFVPKPLGKDLDSLPLKTSVFSILLVGLSPCPAILGTVIIEGKKVSPKEHKVLVMIVITKNQGKRCPTSIYVWFHNSWGWSFICMVSTPCAPEIHPPTCGLGYPAGHPIIYWKSLYGFRIFRWCSTPESGVPLPEKPPPQLFSTNHPIHLSSEFKTFWFFCCILTGWTSYTYN